MSVVPQLRKMGKKRSTNIPADGNCVYHCLVSFVYNKRANRSRSVALRSEIIEFISKNKNRFKEFVVGDFDQWLASNSQTGEWGGHLTLIAAANLFGFVQFFVLFFIHFD